VAGGERLGRERVRQERVVGPHGCQKFSPHTDEQGHYWEFRKALLANKGVTGAAALAPAAAAAKLDAGAFERCLAAGDKKAMVAGNAREAARNRLTGDPVIAVNGILLSGAQDLATIERLLRLESEAL